jgi:hypothetical protein
LLGSTAEERREGVTKNACTDLKTEFGGTEDLFRTGLL